MLLFIAHSKFTPQEVKCRFYGPCAVTSAVLNGVTLAPLTEVIFFHSYVYNLKDISVNSY